MSKNVLIIIFTIVLIIVCAIFVVFSSYAIMNLNSEGQKCIVNPFGYYMTYADIASCSCIRGDKTFVVYQSGFFEEEIDNTNISMFPLNLSLK